MAATVECATCGATLELSVAAQHVACAACGTTAPLPPNVAVELRAAQGVLFAIDVSKRQLDARQQRALASFGCLQGLALVILGLFTLGFVAFSGVVWWAFLTAADGPSTDIFVWLVLPCMAPLALFLIPSLAYLGVLRRRRGKLEEACAATPPIRPGDPAGCHVCGGPLVAQGVAPITRCAYCGADNVVSKAALGRAASRRLRDTGTLAEQITRAASSASSASVAGVLLMPVLALLAPVFTVATWIALVVGAVHVEEPVDRTFQLVWVDSKKGRCVAIWDAARPAGKRAKNSGLEGIIQSPAAAPFDARALVGKRLRVPGILGNPDTIGVVRRAYSTPLFSDAAYVVLADADDERRVEVTSLCE